MHSMSSSLSEGKVICTVPFSYKGTHGCDSVMAMPISGPFRPPLYRFMKYSLGYSKFDTFAVPGFSSKLAKKSKTVWGALDLAYEKHGIKSAIIFEHSDYHKNGDSSRFKTQIQDDQYHKKILISSLCEMTARFPELKVKLFYARLINNKTELEISEIFENKKEGRPRVTEIFWDNGIIPAYDAALINCVDFRIGEATQYCIQEYLRIKMYDIIAIPGAAKSFIEGASVSWKAVHVAYTQHGCRRFIIVHHADCGAYAGLIFANAAEEELYHRQQMDIFEQELTRRYPDAKVSKVYARLIDNQTKIQFVRC